MTISQEILDELLKGMDRPEDLLGDKGLTKELKARLMERMLGAELTQHLGYEPHGECGLSGHYRPDLHRASRAPLPELLRLEISQKRRLGSQADLSGHR